YHFAYMIVSIALLGYGSAGIAVTLKFSPETPEERLEQMRKWALTYALAAPGAVILISRLHFYPLARGLDAGNLATLLIYYSSIAGVLFAAGVTVVTGFKLLAEEVGLLYFADLSGAAFGSLMVLAILPAFGGFGSAALVGLLGTLSAVCLGAASHNPRRGLVAALAVGLFCGWIITSNPFEFPVSASKNIFTWQKPYERESAIEWTSWNPIARVDVTRLLELPIFTTGGAMGAPYAQQHAFYHVVVQDGASPTAITVMDRPIEKMDFLDGYLQTCTYILHPGIKRVMAIGSGGGIDVLIGLFHGAAELVAVEINPDIANLLRTRYRDQTGGLAWLSNVKLVVAEGRHYMARPQDPYDLIQLSASDTNAAASSGAFTFAESYLYTVEAARRAESLLRPGGLLSFSRYAGGPPKDSLRLVAVLRQAGDELGLPEARERTVVLASQSWLEIVVCRDAFSKEAIERLHTWADKMGFQVIYDPFTPGETPYHAYLQASGPQLEEFYDRYPFDVRPPTDDRPFLMQFYKFSSLPSLFWARNFPLAWTILLASLVQIGGLSIAGLLWPVLKDRQKLHTPVPQMVRFFVYF
ncbi:MAG: hypothetical protein KC910_32470, partial [Candidatus Eremiobacteraeota bacterium]|nr:hypothetical protein [Candidatus Eremiobacteraeota bacterium]